MTCSRVDLHDELRVPGAEAGGGQPGEAGLVVDGIVGEAEGEGEHRLRHQLAHHPHDYGRVDPARQEGTQGGTSATNRLRTASRALSRTRRMACA